MLLLRRRLLLLVCLHLWTMKICSVLKVKNVRTVIGSFKDEVDAAVAPASQGCAASPPRAAPVRASVALTFARPPAAPRPKASCLHVASGRHGASLRRAGGFEGGRPLPVAALTHRFRPTLKRPAALLPTRARPSSVRADGRAHELHFSSRMRHRPVCLRDADVFFVKNTKLSVLSALRSTRLRPAPLQPPVRSRILERFVSSES